MEGCAGPSRWKVERHGAWRRAGCAGSRCNPWQSRTRRRMHVVSTRRRCALASSLQSMPRAAVLPAGDAMCCRHVTHVCISCPDDRWIDATHRTMRESSRLLLVPCGLRHAYGESGGRPHAWQHTLTLTTTSNIKASRIWHRIFTVSAPTSVVRSERRGSGGPRRGEKTEDRSGAQKAPKGCQKVSGASPPTACSKHKGTDGPPRSELYKTITRTTW